MSDPVVFEAQSILLKIGDGESPEVFAHDCMINLNRSISITKSMVEEVLYDCDDPDKPGTVYRLAQSVSLSASGTGKTHKTSLRAMLDWALSSAAKNVKIELGGAGGALIQTGLHLTEFTPAEGEPKTYATASMAFASHGAITVSDL